MSTHSSNIINFESLGGTTSFSISIMVKDGKQWAKDTLTIDVIDVNEPPRFVQPAFAASANEDVVRVVVLDYLCTYLFKCSSCGNL